MKFNNVRQILNKSLMYKLVISGVCIFSVSGAIIPNQSILAANEQTFSDVSKNLSSYDAIHWAKNSGIINGYTDNNGKANGKFGPNDKVTEAQFAKMLAIFFDLKDDQGHVTKSTGNNSHWSDTYYDALAKHSVPLSGYFDNKVRMTAIQRGNVAQAIGYLVADQQSLEQSIQFMLEVGITQGQNPQFKDIDLRDFFGSTNHLTRAQAVTFLYRLHMGQFTQLAEGAKEAADGTSIDTKASSALDKLAIEVDSKYIGFFGPENEEIAKLKELTQRTEIVGVFDSGGPVKLPESTPLSRDIASKIGENKLGFEFVGYDDYLVQANIDGEMIFSIVYNKKVPVESPDRGDITISFIKRESFYKLEQYQHNIENLFKYAGISEKDTDTIMKEFKRMYKKDLATVEGSITGTGFYSEYKVLLNDRSIMSYEDNLVMIAVSYKKSIFE